MFRYTETELRGFVEEQSKLWRLHGVEARSGVYPEEVEYARGAYEAYDFVLRFMEEYKLEEVSDVG